MKKYSLTKPESDRLNSLLQVAQIQQEIFDAITARYKDFLIENTFKRLKIEASMFPFCKVDLRTGELIIGEKEKPKNEKN